MRKLKIQSKLKTNPHNNLEFFLNTYESASLLGAISTLENTEAWELFKSYASMVQRQYEVEALDLMGKEGTVKSSAFASGYAKCAEDMANSFMLGLRNTVSKVSPVVEVPRPEE